jgi:hypothetical protein
MGSSISYAIPTSSRHLRADASLLHGAIEELLRYDGPRAGHREDRDRGRRRGTSAQSGAATWSCR